MLVTEELHLLLTDSSGSPVPGAGYRAYAEVAALVVDLMLAGRVTVDTDAEARVHIVSADPTGDALLDAGLARVTPLDGEKLGDIVMRSDLDPWDDVVANLVAAGVLEHRPRGIFKRPATFASEVDPSPEAALRARLASILSGATAPSIGDAVVLTLVQALGLAPRVLGDEAAGLDDAALKQRIEEVSAGVRVGSAVEEAVVTMTQVIMAAVIIPMFINRLI